MPTVRRTRAWTQKPPLSAQINLAHPQAYGMQECWAFRSPAIGEHVDPISLRATTTTFGSGSPTVVQGPDGPVIDGSGAAGVRILVGGTSWSGTNTQPFTLAVRLNFRGGDTYKTIYTAGSASGLYLNGTKVDWYTSTDHNSATSLATNVWSDVAVMYNGSVLSLYINGAADSNTFTGAFGQAYNLASIFSDAPAGGGDHLNAQISFIYLYNYAKSIADLQSLFAHPWQIFQPAAGPWLFPIAGAGPTYQPWIYGDQVQEMYG